MTTPAVDEVVCNICRANVSRDRDLRWRKDGYQILACPGCTVLFRADLPDRDELERIYDDAYFSADAGETRGQGYSDYLGEERNHRANAIARVALLGRHHDPGRLLDVGCAAGFFLDEARRAGWSVEGVELAHTMATYARTRLDLDVHDGSFDTYDDAGAFAAITMWDYIEHSADPAGDLRRASALLEPGGVLALSTGDASSLAARLFGRRWHLLTPRHHNFFFTRQALARALTDAGLRPIEARHRSSRYSLQYLIHKLRTLADVEALERAADALGRSPLRRVAISVNLFDIVTVVAERPATA